ncbi:MAG TPA: hypothetical protein VEC13_00805, partial [Candidatus Paceibacterota bacterium]|nr:hypothetical protein [Candidatus Paceibacterota bacterium]
IFDLKDGESIGYYFPNLLSCDTYWAHIYSLLTEWISKDKPVFRWEPHQWFILGRESVEREILRDSEKKQIYIFFMIQGNTALDQQFKKDWRGDYISININDKNKFNSNYYLHMFDDFLIEVFLDKRLSDRIEEFYRKNMKLDKENQTEFERLVSEKYPIRMKISRNKKKAALLRKKLSKDFYLPSEIKI